MHGTKIDRRVARTRKSLHRALMSLILEKDYETITVDDICNEAEVGRSTFYAHYTGKDELRRAGLDHMRSALLRQHEDALAASEGDRLPPLSFSLPLFRHARDHYDRYRALLGRGGDILALGVIRETISALMYEELAGSSDALGDDAMPREFVVQYAVGAFMAVLTWWLDGGAKQSPEQMDLMFRQLAAAGVLPPQGQSSA